LLPFEKGGLGGFSRYASDPVGYIEQVLKQELWAKQAEIARLLITHKRVFVKASHSVGKSFLADKWDVIEISALDHPNIAASLSGTRRRLLLWLSPLTRPGR
jgi:hypothetical protein